MKWLSHLVCIISKFHYWWEGELSRLLHFCRYYFLFEKQQEFVTGQRTGILYAYVWLPLVNAQGQWKVKYKIKIKYVIISFVCKHLSNVLCFSRRGCKMTDVTLQTCLWYKTRWNSCICESDIDGISRLKYVDCCWYQLVSKTYKHTGWNSFAVFMMLYTSNFQVYNTNCQSSFPLNKFASLI